MVHPRSAQILVVGPLPTALAEDISTLGATPFSISLVDAQFCFDPVVEFDVDRREDFGKFGRHIRAVAPEQARQLPIKPSNCSSIHPLQIDCSLLSNDYWSCGVGCDDAEMNRTAGLAEWVIGSCPGRNVVPLEYWPIQ